MGAVGTIDGAFVIFCAGFVCGLNPCLFMKLVSWAGTSAKTSLARSACDLISEVPLERNLFNGTN